MSDLLSAELQFGHKGIDDLERAIREQEQRMKAIYFPDEFKIGQLQRHEKCLLLPLAPDPFDGIAFQRHLQIIFVYPGCSMVQNPVFTGMVTE